MVCAQRCLPLPSCPCNHHHGASPHTPPGKHAHKSVSSYSVTSGMSECRKALPGGSAQASQCSPGLPLATSASFAPCFVTSCEIGLYRLSSLGTSDSPAVAAQAGTSARICHMIDFGPGEGRCCCALQGTCRCASPCQQRARSSTSRRSPRGDAGPGPSPVPLLSRPCSSAWSALSCHRRSRSLPCLKLEMHFITAV